MVKNRKCLTCRTQYSYCPECSTSDKLAPSWKATFCSEDCMQIWTTCTKFNMGKLTKSEAKSIISEINLKSISEYTQCVQKDLDIILKEEPKPKRSKRVEIKPIDEVIDITQTFIEEAIHEVVDNKENA